MCQSLNLRKSKLFVNKNQLFRLITPKPETAQRAETVLENFRNNLLKIKSPLDFAAKDHFKNIPQIRDFGKSICALIRQVIPTVPPSEKNRLQPPLEGMLNILADYDDARDIFQKQQKITEATAVLDRIIKAVQTVESQKAISTEHEEMIEDRLADLKTSSEKLATPVQYLKGVGPKMAARFAAKKIETVEDLFFFLPRTYEDRREIRKINRLETGKKQTIVAEILSCEFRYYGKKRILELAATDGTGTVALKWFKGRMAYLTGTFKKGYRAIFSGNVVPGYAGKSMIHPDYEMLDADEDETLNFKRIVPVYSETEGLHQKYIRRVMHSALEGYSRYLSSPIPADIRHRRKLMDIRDAITAVHFPGQDMTFEELLEGRSEAHRRLIYDEFFFFQLGMAVKRSGRVVEKGIAFKSDGLLMHRFHAGLPYELTQAQKRVIAEIQKDLQAPVAMNRLLQGDVGSGKTLVAMSAMIHVCENGYQCAFMAPTEILARQHFETLRSWAEPIGLRVVLLTGSTSSAERMETLKEIHSGAIHIVIGTHALIQEDVIFGNLGFVVIDEQHRFGVLQRATLRSKGISADVLVMTATPIPRTLAMTVYGDLDVSVIDEMPPGKKPVRTMVMGENKRPVVYAAIEAELEKGHQVFIVYPLVEQSENLDLKDATRMARHLQEDIFTQYRVGLIHGKMKDKEKEDVMRAFLNNEIGILVSTTVIEVGIDVPRASLMVIEHAERFGLSQLHQLRGRVGRRDIPSSCILLADYRISADARKRLKVMEKTTDGFVLAEEDLAIRGPGDFLGTRQSGLPDFRVASILRDARVLNDAREDAFELALRDPLLQAPQHAILKETLLQRWQGKLDLARTG